ncbi:MAG: FkbM family methyltransferase [Crocinitomicaceae bacterium]|nr:FkbM family methyltransferase [Crocinitomicaceae bacterium]
MGLTGKIVAKLKVMLRPRGHSMIKKGHGKGLIWTHEISDLRYLTGDYEPEIAQHISNKASIGFSFIDIGANAGYYSLLAASKASDPSQVILAIEPMEQNIAQIKNHILLNKLDQIKVLPFAVADSNRELEFSATANLAANTYNSESVFFQNAPKIKIQAKSLDTICQDYSFGKLLLKIDVEGAEADVLRGAVKTLSQIKPEIILATHECHVKGVEETCLSLLGEAGYVCSVIDDQKFVDGQQDYLCTYQK